MSIQYGMALQPGECPSWATTRRRSEFHHADDVLAPGTPSASQISPTRSQSLKDDLGYADNLVKEGMFPGRSIGGLQRPHIAATILRWIKLSRPLISRLPRKHTVSVL